MFLSTFFLNRAIQLIFYQNDGLYLFYGLKLENERPTWNFCLSEKIYIGTVSKGQVLVRSGHIFFMRGKISKWFVCFLALNHRTSIARHFGKEIK